MITHREVGSNSVNGIDEATMRLIRQKPAGPNEPWNRLEIALTPPSQSDRSYDYLLISKTSYYFSFVPSPSYHLSSAGSRSILA